MWIVYELVDPRTNSVRYVGHTATAAFNRLLGHIRTALIDFNPRTIRRREWILGLFREGKCPVVAVWFSSSIKQEALRREMQHIKDLLGQGVDLLNIMGRKRSKEWCVRLGLAGRGKTRTAAQRAHNRRVHLGIKCPRNRILRLGKTYAEIYGPEKGLALRKKQSDSQRISWEKRKAGAR